VPSTTSRMGHTYTHKYTHHAICETAHSQTCKWQSHAQNMRDAHKPWSTTPSLQEKAQADLAWLAVHKQDPGACSTLSPQAAAALVEQCASIPSPLQLWQDGCNLLQRAVLPAAGSWCVLVNYADHACVGVFCLVL